MKTGNYNNLARSQCFAHAVALDVENLGLGMNRVGDDAHLRTSEADCLNAETSKGHRDQRHGNALACGEEHVHFSAGMGV